MAKMYDKKNCQYAGETKVYESIEHNLPDSIICYYNREINGHEFDFCLLVKNLGLVVIEVKGWVPEHIAKIVSPDEIYLKNKTKPVASPKKQANGYRFALLNLFNSRFGINPVVVSCVAYPFLTEADYKQVGLDIVSDRETTLFKEDLEDAQNLSSKLSKVFKQNKVTHADKTSGSIYDIIRGYFENKTTMESAQEIPNYSELRAYRHELSLAEIENIIKKYTSGTKQIVFVQSNEELKRIAKNINNHFSANNIACAGGKMLFNSTANSVFVENNKLQIFNFEGYSLSELPEVITTDLFVANGNMSDEILNVVNYIAEKTKFNIQQYEIEHAPSDKHIQIKAGAGTGKTYSMISRISYICHGSSKTNVLDPASEIAMLTFTDEAAVNMRNRLKLQFRNYFVLTRDKHYLDMVSNVERMRISTIHSFARDIIQRTSLPIGIGTNFATVTGSFQRKQIFKAHLSKYFERKIDEDSEFVYKIGVSIYDIEKYMLELVDKCYNKGIDLREVPSDAFGPEIKDAPYLKEIIAEAVRGAEIEYAQFLIDNNYVALSDYMIYLRKCVSDSSFNAKLYRYKFLFIDEFQDVDDVQIEIFNAMKEKINFKYFIVGDLKQSIYRFRGATMDAFTKMGCSGDDWRKFSLNTNYRSDHRLLEEYEGLFEDLGKKDILPYSQSDALSGVKQGEQDLAPFFEKVCYCSDEMLYSKLYETILERKQQLEGLKQTKHLSEKERTIAILVRKNSEIKDIIKFGKENNLLIESDKNTNLYKIQSTIDLCKLTSALCNPYNTVYLYDLLYSNNVGIEISPLHFINKTEEEKLQIMTECLDMFYTSTMNKTWAEVVSNIQTHPTLKVLREIYTATKPWKNYSGQIEKQTYYRINYELLFETLARQNRKNYLTLEGINESLQISISTGQEAKSRDVVEDGDYVKIVCLTVHASKGLEYDTVIMPYTQHSINDLKKNTTDVSCVDGKIGYCFSFNGHRYYNDFFDTVHEINEIVREETRILYVALTRAISKCVWFCNEDNRKYNWNTLMEDFGSCR